MQFAATFIDDGTARPAVAPAEWSRRLAEITTALALLVFLAPILLPVVLLIFLHDRGPIFFGHERIGRNGRHFKLLKFRTMVVDAEERLAAILAEDPDARLSWERDHKLRHDPRITRSVASCGVPASTSCRSS